MNDWYIPITIVPGLSLLILSTSSLMTALSNEINTYINSIEEKGIIIKKLTQLKLLNMALVFFYISVALLLISAVVTGIYTEKHKPIFINIIAVTFSLIGLFSLIVYSFRAVSIRQNQFKNKID